MTDEWATVWDHLHALRKTAIYSFVTIAIGFFIAFYFSDRIIHWLTLSLDKTPLTKELIEVQRLTNHSAEARIYHLPKNGKLIDQSPEVKQLYNDDFSIPPQKFIEIQVINTRSSLVLISPLEGMLTSLKVALWSSLGITSPLWGFYLLQFILPGLHPREKKLLIPFIALSIIFMGCGISFAHFGTIPLANEYLMNFNRGLGTNLWSIHHYIDYTLVLFMANAIGFELCAVLLFGVHLEFFTAEAMRRKRRHVILGAFIIAAILTPPDVLTQFLLALPLLCVYECAILYAVFLKGRKSQNGVSVIQH